MRNIVFVMILGLSALGYAQNKSPFHAVVAQDGSGNYTSVQSAIDAAPDNSGEPWLIFVKNGSYREQVIVPKSKIRIHLIGQDRDKTIIHHNLNVGGKPQEGEDAAKTAYWQHSVHNPSSEVAGFEGSVVKVEGEYFYSENISYVNDWGVDSQAGPQALAMSTQADAAAFSNCAFRSFQDTWMTSSRNDSYRLYAHDCWIEGAVDYFYGGGDALLENCTFYNVRSGSVIVAPCHKEARYGYVFRHCVVDGNEAAASGKQKLGRPWHNAPRTYYIHTTMRIPIAPEGWTNMGTIPEIFAEYDSRDAAGNLLDLSQRKTEYEGRGEEAGTGSCRATITAEEAEKLTYERIILRVDGWNPRQMMTRLSAPEHVVKKGRNLRWKAVQEAAGYVILVGDKVVGFSKGATYTLPANATGSIRVKAVNRYGSLGKAAVL